LRKGHHRVGGAEIDANLLHCMALKAKAFHHQNSSEVAALELCRITMQKA
jgi:hypothetical protein